MKMEPCCEDTTDMEVFQYRWLSPLFRHYHAMGPRVQWSLYPEVEKVVDSASLTRRKHFQKLGLTENIWENIMG